jgi:hypothetical protein
MYVYIKSEPGLYTVGHYSGPDDAWTADSDHDTPEAAAERVAFLNGNGKQRPLTRREQFAAKAMAGLLASDGTVKGFEIDEAILSHAGHVARQAVAQADALIRELNRTAKEDEDR